MRRLLALLAVLLAQAAPAPTQTPARAVEPASSTLAQQYAAARNSHDAQAVTALFAESADYVGPDERVVVGRDQILKVLLHTNAKDSSKDATVVVTSRFARLIRPDVALADWDVVTKGQLEFDGASAPPQAQRVAVVITRESGGWVVTAMRASRPRPATTEEIGNIVPSPR